MAGAGGIGAAAGLGAAGRGADGVMLAGGGLAVAIVGAGAAAAGAGTAAGGGGAATGGGGGAGAAMAGFGVAASTAVRQAGDSLAAFFCRHCSASTPPGFTLEQFDMKSERQDDRIAACWSAVTCACAPEAAARTVRTAANVAVFFVGMAGPLAASGALAAIISFAPCDASSTFFA